jgi:hypothetical protein
MSLTLTYSHFGDAAGTPLNWQDSASVSVETLCEYIKKGYYDVDPPHQRNVVHSVKWKEGIISSLMGEAPGDIPALRWHPVTGHAGKKIHISLDGKQRLTAITEFKANKFKWRGKYYEHSELPSLSPEERNRIDDFKIINKTTNRTLTPEEITRSFNRFQQTQQTKLGERLHAVTTGRLSMEMDKLMKAHQVPISKLFSETLRRRFNQLEIYTKCFFYFLKGPYEKCENDAIQKMWEKQMSPDYEPPSANVMRRFGKLMRRTLYALIDPRNANVSHKRTKILQMFLLMNWSYPQTENRAEHYEFICENLSRLVTSEDYGNVGGNHSAHVVHFEYLRDQVQAAEFKDASTGEEDA